MHRWDSFRFIAAALRYGFLGGEPPAIPARADWSAILEASRHHHVIAPLAWALRRDQRVPEPWAGELRAALAANAIRNESLAAALVRIVDRLHEHGIEPILLKGAANLVAALYPVPAARYLTDLDLLIPGPQVHEAQRRLLAEGFEAPRHLAFVDVEQQHLPRLLDPRSGAAVELHRAVMFPEGRVIPAAEFAARVRIVSFRGRAFQVPDPTIRLAHNVAHAQIGHDLHREGYAELRQLLDLALLRAHHEDSLEWQQIESWFRSVGRETVLADNLKLAELLLGQPVPPLATPPDPGVLRLLQKNVERPGRRRGARLARIVLRYLAMIRARPAALLNLFAPGLWPHRFRLVRNAMRPRW